MTSLPPCPICKQSSTGCYRGRAGCSRCVALGPVVRLKGAIRRLADSLATLGGAASEATKGVETIATAMEQLTANSTSVPA